MSMLSDALTGVVVTKKLAAKSVMKKPSKKDAVPEKKPAMLKFTKMEKSGDDDGDDKDACSC